MKWLTLSWWLYLFGSPNPDTWSRYKSKKWRWPGWEMVRCRARGHAGPVWFNPGAYEPDMHCRRCGEDLG